MKHQHFRRNGGARTRHTRFPILIGMALPLLLAGCQDEALVVSLEEAKKITASFEGQSFVPPPRMITDVTEILDSQKRDDPIAARKISEYLDSEPPVTRNRAVLAEFYFDRGRLAQEEGRMKQSIDDLRMAYQYADRLDPEDRSSMTRWLARAENKQRRCGSPHRQSPSASPA